MSRPLIMAALILFIGCQAKEKSSQKIAVPKKGALSGQVFVATKSGENVKLGIVKIRAIKEEHLYVYFSVIDSMARDEFSQITSLATKQLDEAKRL